MNLREYQLFTRTTAVYPESAALFPQKAGRLEVPTEVQAKSFTSAIAYVTVGFVSEVGELADMLKLEIRDKTLVDPDRLMGEIGDITWYAARTHDHWRVDWPDGTPEESIEHVNNTASDRPIRAVAVPSALLLNYLQDRGGSVHWLMWYLNCVLQQYCPDVTMSQVLERNMAKLKDRQARNVLHGKGENR